jgi:uncharacterized protein (DUF1697 family)
MNTTRQESYVALLRAVNVDGTGHELESIIASNPFYEAPGNRVVAMLLPTTPSQIDITQATGKKSETLALGKREIYIHYPDGMANSKLQIPAANRGTARNMNTMQKLAQLCRDL